MKDEVPEDVLYDVGGTVDKGAELMITAGVPDIFGWAAATDWIFIEAKSPYDKEQDSQFNLRFENLDEFPIFHLKLLNE